MDTEEANASIMDTEEADPSILHDEPRVNRRIADDAYGELRRRLFDQLTDSLAIIREPGDAANASEDLTELERRAETRAQRRLLFRQHREEMRRMFDERMATDRSFHIGMIKKWRWRNTERSLSYIGRYSRFSLDPDPTHVTTDTTPWPYDPTNTNKPPRPFLLPDVHSGYAINEPIRQEHLIVSSDPSNHTYFWNDVHNSESEWYPFPGYVDTNPFRKYPLITNGNYQTHGNCGSCLGFGPLGDMCMCNRVPYNLEERLGEMHVFRVISVDGLCHNALQLAIVAHSPIIWGPGRRLVRWTEPPRQEMTEGEFLEVLGDRIAEHFDDGRHYDDSPRPQREAREEAVRYWEEQKNFARSDLLLDWRAGLPSDLARRFAARLDEATGRFEPVESVFIRARDYLRSQISTRNALTNT